MKLFLKRLLAVLSTIAAVFAVIALVLVLIGYRPFVLESPSMEPLFAQGSLCWVDTRAPLSDLKKGDVLAYRSPADSLVLHRLVDIESSGDDEIVVHLQGDANNTVQEVTLSRVNFVGREAFTIPGLGRLVSTISSQTTRGLVILLIILACVPRLPRLSRLFNWKTRRPQYDHASHRTRSAAAACQRILGRDPQDSRLA